MSDAIFTTAKMYLRNTNRVFKKKYSDKFDVDREASSESENIDIVDDNDDEILTRTAEHGTKDQCRYRFS